MNNPLNQAHFQSRKAEQLSVSGKYLEAIACHEKAVELLDHVLGASVPASSIESLTLQRDNHIKQQGILRLRNYQRLSRRQHAQKIAQAKFPDIEIRQEKELQHRPVKQSRENQALRHCFQETDTLLNFLENRRTGSLLSFSDYDKAAQESVYRKLPKDDRTIIEELRGQNSMLRDHVIELLRENDSLRGTADNARRVETLVDRVISESIMFDSSEPEAFCDLPPGGVDMRGDIELPPLETPQFEFRPET